MMVSVEASFFINIVVYELVYGFESKSNPDLSLDSPHHNEHFKNVIKQSEGGFTKPPAGSIIPENFKDHPELVDVRTSIMFCNYAERTCKFGHKSDIEWTANVNNKSKIVSGPSLIYGDPTLVTVNIVSPELSGTKCLYFSTFSNSENISFSVSFLHDKDETTTTVPGNKMSVKRISIGVGTDKPYKVSFHLYAFDKKGRVKNRPDDGVAIIGQISIVDGPCSPDKKSLDCEFDYSLCHWVLHNDRYIWYPLPFGNHETIKHRIKWGVLASFVGESSLWSPVVRRIRTRCFSFVYAKSGTHDSFLRVWQLYKIPGAASRRVLLYEDVSPHKVFKKLVQVNVACSFKFQIAFEGRSETILQGVIILQASITCHRCNGIGMHSDFKHIQTTLAPSSLNKSVLLTEFETEPLLEKVP